MTPLMHASLGGHFDLAEALVDKGADVNAASNVRRRRAGCDETRWHFRESGCVAVEGGLLRWPRYMYPAQWPECVLHLNLASSLGLCGGGGHDASGVFGGGVVVTLPFCAGL